MFHVVSRHYPETNGRLEQGDADAVVMNLAHLDKDPADKIEII